MWTRFCSAHQIYTVGYSQGPESKARECDSRRDVAREGTQNCPQQTCIHPSSTASCAFLSPDGENEKENGQDLGMREASVLDARKRNGTEVSLSGGRAGSGNVESGAPWEHPGGIMSLVKEAGVINAALGISGWEFQVTGRTLAA